MWRKLREPRICSVRIPMKIELFDDAEIVAQEGARIIAAAARAAVTARGRFVVAVSGGQTPWIMLRALANQDVPWGQLRLAQVDERVAPAGSNERNLTHLRESLLDHAPLRSEQVFAMPVESSDLDAGARAYASALQEIAG
jgi:6-phosphogluconolactonase